MIRVCLKNNPDITGKVVGEKAHGGLLVVWDGDDPTDSVWIIGRDRLVFLDGDKPEEE